MQWLRSDEDNESRNVFTRSPRAQCNVASYEVAKRTFT